MKALRLLSLLAFGSVLAGCPGGGGGGDGGGGGGGSTNTTPAPSAEAAAYNPTTGTPLGSSTAAVATTIVPAAPIATPTPAPALDLTCVVVWNSQTNSKQMGGCAIAADTVLFAEHYHPAVGARLRFVGSDGVAVERTIISIRALGPANAVDNYQTDVAKATLDQPLPGTVHPAPAVFYGGSGFIDDQVSTLHWTNLTYANYATWPEAGLVNFDSGSPVLAVVNGLTSMVSLVTRTNSGPAIATVLAANP